MLHEGVLIDKFLRKNMKYLVRCYSVPFFRRVLSSTVHVQNNKSYIFIVGCYNSGTTLLDYLLKEHDEISGLITEGQALTGELYAPEDFGWNRMWHMCQNMLEISQLYNKPDPVRLKKEWGFWFDQKKPFWLEKSIINSLNIDWLENNFSDPYFIWILRNGYAVAEGIKRRTDVPGKHPSVYTEGYPIEMCARQWVVSNQVIEQKLRKAKNQIKINYEELTLDPLRTINGILRWLPIKHKRIRLPPVFKFHNQTNGIRDMNEESFQRLSREEIRRINTVAHEMLLHHGYEVFNLGS